MTQAEFDARMPVEFWREVVDRVAAEVPDTLLLAEAFWMLEGYFVRTLGMHRVYNSAFMHMLRDEDGAGYRKVIKETLEFDPEILKRYVNFMSNPDEGTARRAVRQGRQVLRRRDGHGDDARACRCSATARSRGYGEKYGMEFRRATLDEQPDPWLVERHEREIFPLLHRRAWFAEAHDFLLYDFVTDGGGVDEHVFAYSNGTGRRARSSSTTTGSGRPPARSASPRRTRASRRAAPSGWSGARSPRASACPTTRRRSSRSATPAAASSTCARAASSGSAACGSRSMRTRATSSGSSARSTTASPASGARLAERLGGRGVPSLDEALRELQLEPVHAPLAGDLRRRARRCRPRRRARPTTISTTLEDRLRGVPRARSPRRPAYRATRWTLAAADPGRGDVGLCRWGAATPLARRTVPRCSVGSSCRGSGSWHPAPTSAATSRPGTTSCAWRGVVAAGFRSAGLERGGCVGGRGPGAGAAGATAAIGDPGAWTDRRSAADRDAGWRADPIRAAMGVNTWEGVEWLDRDRFVDLLRWAARLDAIDSGRDPDERLVQRLGAAAEATGYRIDALLGALEPAGHTAQATLTASSRHHPTRVTPNRRAFGSIPSGAPSLRIVMSGAAP